ncbi:hypothetical protein V6x_52520 [Gimesia chilikensis]|uniref:Uncharacterized protein n=1 Tax=Gimesia chilikensis TaxID=2605989 RepID=A0A517WJT1_9PLAN|nr:MULTISPECIES: hypothetical protein [Gimesia]QDU05514.1 hypothetical protein V6x_52520 [Gimesia chilikensis]
MTNPVDVKIGCSKNNDGTFNAGVFLNGQQMADFPPVTGDCDAILDLWNKVRDYFPEQQ